MTTANNIPSYINNYIPDEYDTAVKIDDPHTVTSNTIHVTNYDAKINELMETVATLTKTTQVQAKSIEKFHTESTATRSELYEFIDRLETRMIQNQNNCISTLEATMTTRYNDFIITLMDKIDRESAKLSKLEKQIASQLENITCDVKTKHIKLASRCTGIESKLVGQSRIIAKHMVSHTDFSEEIRKINEQLTDMSQLV